MTFATESAKLSSERYTLVRLQYGEYREDEFTLVSGDTYRIAWTGYAVNLFRNGALFTEDTGLSADFTWYFDESAGYVYARSSTAMEGGTVIFNALHFSTKENVHTYSVPTDSTKPVRFWACKLKNDPNFISSFSDTLSGTISVSSGSIEIDNTDREFENYLGPQMTFNRKPIEAWIVVNGEIQKAFTGILGDVSLTQNNVSISTLESIGKMSQPCYMGDTKDEAFLNDTADSAPNMYPEDDGSPWPYIFGRSATNLKNYAPIKYITAGPTNNYLDAYSLDCDKSARAICTQYTNKASGTVNRVWVTCRTNGAFKTLNFGTIATANLKTNSSGVGDYVQQSQSTDEDKFRTRENVGAVVILTYASATHNLEVGDSFKISGGTLGANPIYVLVSHITTDQLTIYCSVANRGGAVAAINLITCTFNTNSAPALAVLYNDKVYNPVYEQDFTVSTTTTSSGNIRQVITFTNSWEVGTDIDTGLRMYYGLTYLHPSTHRVYYRATQSASYSSHGNSMLYIVQNAKLETYDTSFTTADTDFDVDCAFQVPYIGSTEYPTYLEAAQYICRSTFGYLKTDDNGVNYNVIQTLGASTKTLTENMLSSVSCRISYGDAKAAIKMSNPHLNSLAQPGASGTGLDTVNEDLNEADETLEVEHCLYTSVGALSLVNYNNAYRKAHYSISAPTALLDVEVGDIVTIQSPAVLGGSGTVDGMVISIDKSATMTHAEVSDMRGLIVYND